MDFVAVVDQAMALLRQRGRVTYRTLQRQFQLDAEALTDLLAELRYAHPDAIREDDQGVVWTGDAGTAAALAPPSIPRDQPLARPADLPSPAAPPGTAPSTPDAERRQLTVLFCDRWTRLRSRHSSIRKTGVGWCGPIKTPAPR